jgi:hypothetical protein
MVFDDFDDVDKEDILFLRHLFPIFVGKKVILFVLVRDKATANRLIELNGRGRIAPLEGICEDVSTPEDEEKKPEWSSVVWTQKLLQELARSEFGDIRENMPEMVDGENTLDILAKSRKLRKK